MIHPHNLLLLVNPDEYNDRAFVPPDSQHATVLQTRGWKPLAELKAEDRKKIADFYKAPGHTAEVLEAFLWDASQPNRRDVPATPPPPLRYTGRPPKVADKR